MKWARAPNTWSYKMLQVKGRSLSSHLEAYHRSLKSCYASQEPGHPTLECIRNHVVALIGHYVWARLQEDQSPFCILSVGSGDGGNDLAFLEILSEQRKGKGERVQLFERVIEPDSNNLEAFRDKADKLPDILKSRANVDFEWHGVTFQEYAEQKEGDDVKFDIVHFLHSLYYVGLETALEHCYEKELGAKGVILCTIQREDSALVKYGRTFATQQGMVFFPGVFYCNKDVKDVAEKNGWKYVECSGESKTCDITAIFDSSSQLGNHLLDFLTHWVDVRTTASQEDLQNILDYWRNESVDDGQSKKMVMMKMGAIIIFKGL